MPSQLSSGRYPGPQSAAWHSELSTVRFSSPGLLGRRVVLLAPASGAVLSHSRGPSQLSPLSPERAFPYSVFLAAQAANGEHSVASGSRTLGEPRQRPAGAVVQGLTPGPVP